MRVACLPPIAAGIWTVIACQRSPVDVAVSQQRML